MCGEPVKDIQVSEGLKNADLIARKLAGPEQSTLDEADLALHQFEFERLRVELQAAHDASTLRELPEQASRTALNDLLVRMRLKTAS